MFTAKEIRQITFEKVVRGYRPEDVESFMDKIADEYENLVNEKQEIEDQLYILAEKIEQYKVEEESIKATLISAQKLGESIIAEANQKAESILKDATIRKNDILSSAHEEISGHEENLIRIKKEVSDFKVMILSLYCSHIESLRTIPEVAKEPAKEVIPEADEDVALEFDTVPSETLQNVSQSENILPPEETVVVTKKLIDDYALSPDTHQGFNNISTLFDK